VDWVFSHFIRISAYMLIKILGIYIKKVLFYPMNLQTAFIQREKKQDSRRLSCVLEWKLIKF